ncbi:MAG TPA: YceI family protein [Mucilaginibacter sp.]
MKRLFGPLLIIMMIPAGFTLVKNTVTRSAITFQTKNMGIGVGGTISGLQADIRFNPVNLASSAIDASVDAGSINTDNSSRDDHLKDEDFFDVSHYPKIIIKSVSFRHKSGDKYAGLFNLTIKGKTKLMEIPFTITEKNNTIAFKGSFNLNRLDFGIGDSSLILSNEVTVNVDAMVRE